MNNSESNNLKVLSTLPIFDGFHETSFDAIQDEDIIERFGLDWENVNFKYEEYRIEVAIECTEVLNNKIANVLTELLGVQPEIHDFDIDFNKIVYPKNYYYYNDEIEVIYTISQALIDKIIDKISDNKEMFSAFEEFIKRNCTSYEGFVSYYSNNAYDWLNSNFDIVNNPERDNYVILKTLFEFLLEYVEYNVVDLLERVAPQDFVLDYEII